MAKIIEHEKEELGLLYEDLELKVFTVAKSSRLAGRSLGEIDLPTRFGCGVVAIERSGEPIVVVKQDTVIAEGDLLVLIGSEAGIESFDREFRDRLALGKFLKKLDWISRLSN